MLVAGVALSLFALPVLAAPPATGSAPPQAPPAQAAPAVAPVPDTIPVPDVARRAEEVGRQLRDLDALMPEPLIGSIERRLPSMIARTDRQLEETDRQLETGGSGAILDGLTAQWQASRAETGGYVNVLARTATELEDATKRLTTLQETWTRARADARASRAPAQVVERIDGVLTAIAASRARMQAQRAAALVLQDRFAHEVARCERVLERIARVRQERAGRLLERDSAPLWHPADVARATLELPDQARAGVAAEAALLRQFAQDQRWKIPLQIALFLALALGIRAARQRARLLASSESTIRGVRVFDRWASAALLLALLATPWIYSPPLPRSVGALAGVLALGPALRLMRVVLDPSLGTGLYLLGAFFLADILRHSVSAVPPLERPIFILEMLAAVVVLAWRLYGRPRAARAVGRQRALRIVAIAVLIAFAAALGAGVAGYARLALLIGGRILGTCYLALLLYAGVRVGDGLVAFALRARPLRELGMVERKRPVLERRAHGALRWLAIGAWVGLALRYFGLWPATVSLSQAVLGAELRRGSLAVSLGDVLVFAVTVAAAYLLSAFLRFVLEEDVYPRLDLGRGVPYALSSFVHYLLLLAGFLLALAALGVDLTKVTILAGAFGVGIGFGLQHVVNNFVSGTLILFERKINVGDAIQVGGIEGQVEQMGLRACTVRTWEGAEVIVPNAALTSDKVTNWTLSDRLRRIDVAAGVAYGTPPGQVLDVLLAVARAHPRVLADPEPVALFRGFGESALMFEMRVWTDRFDLWVNIQSELTVALYEALRKAGIEIPVPQREVRWRRADVPHEPHR